VYASWCGALASVPRALDEVTHLVHKLPISRKPRPFTRRRCCWNWRVLQRSILGSWLVSPTGKSRRCWGLSPHTNIINIWILCTTPFFAIPYQGIAKRHKERCHRGFYNSFQKLNPKLFFSKMTEYLCSGTRFLYNRLATFAFRHIHLLACFHQLPLLLVIKFLPGSLQMQLLTNQARLPLFNSEQQLKRLIPRTIWQILM